MLIAALLITAPNWKELRYPSTGKWITPPWGIHAMELHSAAKRSEPLWCTQPTWYRQGTGQSEKRQSQNITHCVTPFICHCCKILEVENKLMVVLV